MRKKLRFLFLPLLLSLFTLSAAGQTTPEVTLDFTSNDWGLPVGSGNKGTTARDFTSGRYTITLEATSSGYYFNNTDKYLMLGKTGATLTLPVFDFDVEKIVVTGRSGASTGVKMNVYVGDDAVSTPTTGITGSNTYEISSAYQAAGNVYALKVTSSHNAQITKIEIYKKESSLTNPDLKFTTTPNDGSDYRVLRGSTMTLTAASTSATPSSGAITFTSTNSDSNVSVTDNGDGTVTIDATNATANSTFTLTASIAATSTHSSGTVQVTVNVSLQDPMLEFTSTDGLESGEYKVRLGQTVTIQATSTSSPASSGAVTYTWDPSAVSSLATVTDNNDGTVTVTALSDADAGTFTLTASIAAAGSFEESTATATVRIIDTRATPDFYWSTNAVTLTAGDEFTAPTLTNTSDGTVTYSSSNPSVATIDENTGEVALAGGFGTTTITASVEKTATYKAATASYTLTVQDLSGDTYVLVTDINELSAGDEIIILNYANKMAMSTNQKSNNRGATSITIKGSTAYANDEVQVITLEGDADGWYFNVGNGYLYAASSSSNNLKTETTPDANDNAKAMIGFSGYVASVVFQGTNTRNVLQFNTSSDGLFACYSSASQKDVEIFKKGTPPAEVTITQCRALADGTSTVLALDGSTVLGNYIDAEGCHVFVRDGKGANQAIEILLAGESSAPTWATAKYTVSGAFTGIREKTATVDRLNCSGPLAIPGEKNSGDVTPVELSDVTNIADYSGNSVVLTDLACTNDGTTCTIGGLTASTVFKGYTLPYEGAYVDVGGIAYNGNTLHLMDYSEGSGATQSHRCFVYVFDENRAMALPTPDNNNYNDVTARMVRTFYADGWNTLRLPFHDTTEDFLSVFGADAILSEFNGLEKDAESNTLIMRFSGSNATTPGNEKNLLLKLGLSENLVNPKFARVTIDPDKGADKSANITLGGETYTVTYRGILAPTQINANDGTKLFLGTAGNELVYASVTNNLRATRCYFDLSFDVLAADASINTAFFEVTGEEVTAIDGVPVMTAKQGAVYTVQGQYVGERLEGLSKGVYIVNGKKVVIK